MKSNRLKLNKRVKTNLLRTTAFGLFIIMIVNSTVAINAYTPQTYQYSMVNGELMLLDDDQLPLDDVIGTISESMEEPTTEPTAEEIPTEIPVTFPETNTESAEIPKIEAVETTENPDNKKLLQSDLEGAAQMGLSIEGAVSVSPEIAASVSPTTAESTSPTVAPSASPTASAGATPSATPKKEVVSKLTVDENGNISGINLTKLKVNLSYSNKEMLAADTFALNIKSEDGEISDLKADNMSVAGSGNAYSISGIGREISGFTISGLDNKAFIMYVVADSSNETELSFSYDASVETGESDISAVLSIKVSAEETGNSDDEGKEKEKEFSGESSAFAVSSANAVLSGDGIDAEAKFVVKDTSDNTTEFESFIKNSGYDLLDGGLYVFDMQFEKDGKYVAVNQNTDITLKFSPALFADISDVQYYLVLHAGDTQPLAKINGSDEGLSEISFSTGSFSPFAVAAVSEDVDENPNREPKIFDMEARGWITGSSVSKKVGTAYIPISDSSITLDDSDVLKLTIQYKINENITFVEGDTMTYAIPEYLSLVNASGEVMGNNSMVAGHYQIDAKTRTLTIIFDDEKYIASTQGKFSGGMITFDGKLDISKLEADETGAITILYSVAKCKVNLGPEKKTINEAFEIEKKHDVERDQKDALAYTITISAKEADPEETYTEVQVVDKFTTGGACVTYDQKQFPDVTVTFDESANSFVWTIGEMKSGDTKEITYYVKYDSSKFGGTTLKNEAVLTTKELPGELKATSTVIGNSGVTMSKTVVKQKFTSENGEVEGNYNWDNHTVKYQIKVEAPASNAFAVNDVVVRDVFKATDGSNEYVLDKYVFESVDGENAAIANQSKEGFDWKVGTLQPGESKTLVYTVELEDYSSQGESAYSNNKYDIWYRGEAVSNPTYNLDNSAKLYTDNNFDKVISEKTATVKFNRTFVKKDKDHVTVNAEEKTVTFEILANGNANVPAFNIAGWQFRDEVSNGWKYTGTLKVYAFDKYTNHAGNATPVRTYSFGAGATDKYFTFSNSADGSESSWFTFTVPDTEDFNNKFLILKYDIGLVDNSKWGTINYSNSIGYGGGNGWSILPPSSMVNLNAAFGGGIEKRFVSRSKDILNWESTITADITKGSTVRDWVANSNYQIFQENELSLVVKQGGEILKAGSDYSCKLDSKGQFTVTFFKNFDGPITLNYNTRINKDYFKSDGTTSLQNNTELKVPCGTDPAGNIIYLTDTSSAVYSYPHYSDISKSIKTNCLTTDGTLEWKIIVNKSGGMTNAVVQEVAPEGTVIDLDSIKIGAKGSKAAAAKIVSKELTDDGKGAIIKLEGLEETLDTNAYVEIWVKTKVVDDDFWMGENASVGRQFVNKAILLDENGETVKEVTANYAAKYSPIAKNGTYNSQTGELTYTIVVNQNSNDLLQNEDSITLVDDMDPSISVIPESIVVTGKNGAVIDTNGKINYKPSGVENGFAIIIPDDQKVTITYKVQVNAAVGTKLSVSNSAYFYGKEVEVKPVEKKMEFYVQTCGITVLSDQILLHKTTNSGNPLEGAEFKIYTVDSNGARSFNQKITTDADGNAVINGLIAGKLYAYEEIKAPAGYMFESGDVHYFWISESDATKAPVIPAGISNVETYQFKATIYVVNDRPGFAVIKTGDDGEKLAGAEFALYQGDTEVAKSVTDSNGQAVFKELEAGSSYRLEETKAPDSYVKGDSSYLINIDQAGRITIEEQSSSQPATYAMGGTVESGTVSYPSVVIKNELKKGTLKLIKKDSEDGSLLEGAVFELYQVTDTADNSMGIRYPSDTVTYTTDAKGEIVVEELPVGTYYFKEIIAPECYQLSDNLESERVTLNKANVEESIRNPLTVEVTNKKLSGIVLQKVGPNGEELKGAEFELYKEDGTLVGSYVTGANGVLKVIRPLDEGNYYFVEIKAPEGYMITTDNNGEPVKYSFTVDAEHNSITGIDLGKIENRNIPTPAPEPEATPVTTPPTDGELSEVSNSEDQVLEVLGARRVKASGLDAAVLGARRGRDYAVLGRRRRPSTGDSMAMLIWIIIFGAAAGGAIAAGIMLYTKKKDEKK